MWDGGRELFILAMWSLGKKVTAGQIVNSSARFRKESHNNHVNVNSLYISIGEFDFNNKSNRHTNKQIESNLISKFSSPGLQNSH